MTVYTFDHNTVSDLHKDVYGFRPTKGFWEDWAFSNDDEKQAVWDNLLIALEQSIEAEEEAEMYAVGAFEGRIEDAILSGSTDRTAAIYAVLGSVGLSDDELLYGGEYICFKLGLPYAYSSELDAAVAEMQQV